MSFSHAHHHADALTSMKFEGLPTKVNYDEEKLYMINTTQIYGLLNQLTPKARSLYISKFLEQILADINNF